MIPTDLWKNVFRPHDLDELYDLKSYTAKTTNLVNDSTHAERLNEKKAWLMGWNDATGDMFHMAEGPVEFSRADQPITGTSIADLLHISAIRCLTFKLASRIPQP